MAFLYFLAALLGIIVFAVLVNRLTGTKANYLEALTLEPGERELWRDAAADFATRPRLGQALVMSFPRMHRHTAVWTTQRVVIAQRVLGAGKHLITHQVLFESAPAPPGAAEAATKFGGGFYGRGFETLRAASHSFSRVNAKDCVCLVLSADSSAVSNVLEAYVFSDRLSGLRAALA
jgi:hypothetical protein